MKARRQPKTQSPPPSPYQTALSQARTCRRRGKLRDELRALRKACALDEYEPVAWTLLGVLWCRMGRRDEALSAFRHALWLRERQGDDRRAGVMRRLIARVEGHELAARAA